MERINFRDNIEVIAPIHVDSSHWVLLTVSHYGLGFQQKRHGDLILRVYDSLGGREIPPAVAMVRRLFERQLGMKSGSAEVRLEKVAQQQDGSSCGVLVCVYANLVSRFHFVNPNKVGDTRLPRAVITAELRKGMLFRDSGEAYFTGYDYWFDQVEEREEEEPGPASPARSQGSQQGEVEEMETTTATTTITPAEEIEEEEEEEREEEEEEEEEEERVDSDDDSQKTEEGEREFPSVSFITPEPSSDEEEEQEEEQEENDEYDIPTPRPSTPFDFSPIQPPVSPLLFSSSPSNSPAEEDVISISSSPSSSPPPLSHPPSSASAGTSSSSPGPSAESPLPDFSWAFDSGNDIHKQFHQLVI